MKQLFLVCALILTPLPTLAHKVIAGVFPAGDAIEGELGFSSGDMAVDKEVIAFGPDGTELGRTLTDSDGFFIYSPTKPVAHTFRADLGAGHVAEITLPAEDVAEIMGVEVEISETATPDAPIKGPATVVVASISDEELATIAKVVRAETRPLRREIAAYREHNDMQTILGGIGYIVGLFGIGFYFAARKKMAA